MIVLGIETSCDETAVAIVEDASKVHANVIASQISIHAETGGVVPEVASREHVKAIIPVLKKALRDAEMDWDQIDAIAVTKEPGLVGSVIVGRMTASALAFAKDKPLIEVNHIHGHMYSNWLEQESSPEFPVLCLTVSGGHNELVLMHNHGKFELLGKSVDDAAGEAFDKIARMLGLGYPGGPIIEEKAKNGDASVVKFPRAKMEGYNFSFSGLKTAVLYYLQKNSEAKTEDVAAAFQEAALDALVTKVKLALEEYEVKELHLAGGVSANGVLREKMANLGAEKLRFPAKMSYCTDNAAMIAAVGYFNSNVQNSCCWL